MPQNETTQNESVGTPPPNHLQEGGPLSFEEDSRRRAENLHYRTFQVNSFSGLTDISRSGRAPLTVTGSARCPRGARESRGLPLAKAREQPRAAQPDGREAPGDERPQLGELVAQAELPLGKLRLDRIPPHVEPPEVREAEEQQKIEPNDDEAQAQKDPESEADGETDEETEATANHRGRPRLDQPGHRE